MHAGETYLPQRTKVLRPEPESLGLVPKLFNLRRDPYERADITSNTYYDWYIDRAHALYAAQAIVGHFLATLQEFPPRQEPASFTIDQSLEELQTPTNN